MVFRVCFRDPIVNMAFNEDFMLYAWRLVEETNSLALKTGISKHDSVHPLSSSTLQKALPCVRSPIRKKKKKNCNVCFTLAKEVSVKGHDDQ